IDAGPITVTFSSGTGHIKSLFLASTLHITGGSLNISHPTTVTSAGTLTLPGPGTKTLDKRDLINNGRTTWSGSGPFVVQDGSTITNNNLFEATAEQALRYTQGTTPTFTNVGTFRRSGAS